MKINLDAVFENQQGGELTEPSNVDGEVVFEAVTLRGTLYKALLSNDQKASADDKVNRFLLFKKLQAGGPEFEVTAKEAAMLQALVGTVFLSPLYVGQAHLLLEG